MNIGVGDLVQVNVAAFIGSRSRNRESIPCEVLDLQPGRVHVRTQWPYRILTIWVSSEWVEKAERPIEAHSA